MWRPLAVMSYLKHFPWITVSLGFASCLLMLLPASTQALLYFDTQHLQQGNPLGLVTGHWLHADAQHLVWNVAAFLLLGVMLELRSRSMLLISLATGTLFVDLLLLSGASSLQRYCGLSGVLNTLFAVALWLLWRERRHPLVPAVGIAALAKIALEMLSGQAVFTDISWPPYAPAHLAGLLGAVALLAGCRLRSRLNNNNARSHHGYLVTGE